MSNIFDRDPPIVDDTVLGAPLQNGNTTPESYDALGRTAFVSYTGKA